MNSSENSNPIPDVRRQVTSNYSCVNIGDGATFPRQFNSDRSAVTLEEWRQNWIKGEATAKEQLSSNSQCLWQHLVTQRFNRQDLQWAAKQDGWDFESALAEVRNHGIVDEERELGRIRLIKPNLGFSLEEWRQKWIRGEIIGSEQLSPNAKRLWDWLITDMGERQYLPTHAARDGWNLDKAIQEFRDHGILDEDEPERLRLIEGLRVTYK